MTECIFVCTFTLIAMLYDILSYKIPNWLAGVSLITGIAYSFVNGGKAGLLFSVCGVFIPILLLFGLYLLGALGAGDVKLFAAIGAFVQLKIIPVICICFLVAAPIGILAMFLNKKEKMRLYKFKVRLTKMHFAVPVFIGTAVYMIGGILYEL